MPSDSFGVQAVFVPGAADGVEVGFAAGGAGDAPVGELGGGAVVSGVGGEEARFEDAARVEGAGGFVVAGVVVDDQEGVLGGWVGDVVREEEGLVGLFDGGVAEVGA